MAWDKVWEDIFATQDWGKYPGEDLIRFVARNFYKAKDRAQIKILEVGCGPGANIWYMAREGFCVYGVDGSKTAIDTAKKRLDLECNGWQGAVTVGDFCNLNFTDGFFDAVIDNEAICYNSFAESKKIYGEIARILKKEGKLFSRTFAVGTYGYGTGREISCKTYDVDEGPLANKGATRFTELDDIIVLLGDSYSNISVDLLTKSINGDLDKNIREWIITATKI